MATVNTARLKIAGPIDSETGYPLWFEDAQGVRLELVLNNDPFAPVIGEVANPNDPLSFPGNFPEESFYFVAEAELPVGGAGVIGRARVILALEAAFGGAGAPQAGMNVVFARIRVRMDDLIPGAKYFVTHPYGRTDALEADERGRVFHTEDLGLVEGDPTAVVGTGQVAPFLRNKVAAPVGYIGDGLTKRQVIGSPFNTNFVLIEGSGIRQGNGMPDPTSPLDPDRVWTDLFTLQGRVTTRAGAWVDSATYDSTGGTPKLTVAARSIALVLGTPNDLRVVAPGLHVKLSGQGEHYVVVANAAAVPADGSARLYNFDDQPPTSFPLQFKPALFIDQANHDIDTGKFTVGARCLDPTAVLDLPQLGLTITSPSQTFPNLAAVPAVIEVHAKIGGKTVAIARRPVVTTGAATTVVPPVRALAKSAASVEMTTPPAPQVAIELDGQASAGATAFAWTQSGGPAGGTLVSGANSLATFTPAVPGDYEFTLTAQGGGATSTAAVKVAVKPAPGPDQITDVRVRYRTGRRQYDIVGRINNLPNQVHVSVGGNPVGKAVADATGGWKLRRTLSGAEAALVPTTSSSMQFNGRMGNVVAESVQITN